MIIYKLSKKLLGTRFKGTVFRERSHKITYSWLNKIYNFSKLGLQETKYKKEVSRDRGTFVVLDLLTSTPI